MFLKQYLIKGRIMKRLLILVGISILFFSACSAPAPVIPTATPVPPPTPTPTPDPCSKDNILVEAEKLQMAVNEFREVADLANSTDVNFLFVPVLRLQEIRYQAINTKVPACLDAFKASTVAYTASVINYMIVFMNVQDPESEDLKNAIQNSQTQWQVLVNEFNKVLAVAGVEAQPITQPESTAPTPSGSAATAVNETDSAVDMRAKPDPNAEVVASMEKGIQVEVIGRNAASDWLQVKLGDITGWVIAEKVVVSSPIDQLTVVEVIP
jgi:hypothetical protein